ncbi:MAG: ferric reductase-like transmembrane domain-containing protein [Pseudomonadota bacterium]
MTGNLFNVLGRRYLVWLALALPAWPYIEEYFSPGRYYPEMLHNLGVFSIQMLVLTLSVTPLSLILRNWQPAIPFALWLIRNRRYFGVASFAYALIHTLLYLKTISFDWYLAFLEALDWPFATGWIALFVMAILALTSNNWSVKRLGSFWKPLQRLSYVTAITGLAHWLLLDFFIDDVMTWIIVLLVAKSLHILLRLGLFQLSRMRA